MISDPCVLPVNELNFADEVSASPLPVLIDVSTAWCPPCRLAAPIIVELAQRYRGRLKVVEIDGDQSPHLAAALGVRGFPTFLGVVAGSVVTRCAGFGGRGPLNELAATLLEMPSAESSLG